MCLPHARLCVAAKMRNGNRPRNNPLLSGVSDISPNCRARLAQHEACRGHEGRGADIRCGDDPITHKRWKPTFGVDQGRGLFCIAAWLHRAQTTALVLNFRCGCVLPLRF